MKLALYQPDIPQNTGTLMRLCACLGVELDIIEPCSFSLEDKRFKRSLMDYGGLLKVNRYKSWEEFLEKNSKSRLILLTTKSSENYLDLEYNNNDILILGRESAGVPETVHNIVDKRVRIDMVKEARSINVAISAAIVLSEGLRQTK
ncbi:MAG: tRNA (cytidine(34)-2'-O)-methyltransferase [Alphaproteobacteria bacterium]|jgi:tRNA (cytidine/uridine-2'-O-)-methyltransferase|nr:tRNA (cytidine(34)-2'-O)-methyltransferase [Alphaproteobacteria bacterium]